MMKIKVIWEHNDTSLSWKIIQYFFFCDYVVALKVRDD